MINKFTFMIPADRCGIFWVKVFHLYGGGLRKTATIGNFVKISVQDTKTENKIKKKTKLAGIIIRTKKEKKKSDNSWLKFYENNIILLKKRMTPKGREVVGPIISILKRKKFKNSFPQVI